MAVLEARGITKTVGLGRAQRRVLDGVDLRVDEGEVVAVLGRSGSGKSTLLHLLGGLDRPDAGEIVLGGHDITRLGGRRLARARLRHIGFVFQSFHLVEELSGAENVLLPARLSGAPSGGERRGRRLIGELGLAEVADHLPHELSGGEQQRFAIARALVNDPDLVLADEPTGNLDAENGQAVLGLLRELGARGVVLVTHEPDAAGIADRVLRLDAGRLVHEDAGPSRGAGARSRHPGGSALVSLSLPLPRRRRRALLTAVGIALAAAMLTTAVVIADGLGGGFDRAVRAADLPDVIVRFDPQAYGRVRAHVLALPDVAAFSTRTEVTNAGLDANGHESDRASAEVVRGGRRGYAIVAGRDVSARFGEVVIERGVAESWGVRLGQTVHVDELGPLRVVGFAEAPDDVGYPLGVPRFYLSGAALDEHFGANPNPQVSVAEIWLRDPRRLDQVLVQARTTSYGLRGIRIVTRSGVRVLLDQAAGIVIDLLVALSLFALLTAGVMLAASARAEVQRRLTTIGITRAVGASRAHVAGRQAAEAAVIAVPAAAVGILGGVLGSLGPTDRLLTMLNEPPPGIGADPAAGRRRVGQRRHSGARRGVAGVAGGRAPAGHAAAGCGYLAPRLPPGPAPAPRRAHGTWHAARGRPACPPRRHGAHARGLDRVRAAAALAGRRAARAGD